MRLPEEAEKLLVQSGRRAKFVPDPSDIGVIDLIKDWKDIENPDVGLVGIPFDTSTLQMRGSRGGPESVRDAFMFCDCYEPGLDIDISSNLQIVDFGNIDVVHTEVPETNRRIEAVLTAINKSGVIPIVIGGDHGSTYANVKALINSVRGNIGVINIDAHMDVRKALHGEISSGTPFRRLMEEPEQPLLGKNLVELGINGWHNSKAAMDYCRDKGVTIITAREIHRRGIADVVAQALDIVTNGTQAFFLSFDIDGLDFAAAPGNCVPNPGGLTSYEGLEAVWLIGQHPLSRGFDMMEVSPPLDVRNLTSLMGAALIMQYLGAIKKRLERKGK